jgi:hypothetical protein
MVYFQTKIPILGKFWMVLEWKVLVYFMALWSVLRTFGIFHGHSVYFGYVWYIFSRFGMLYKDKSGNIGSNGVDKKRFAKIENRRAINKSVNSRHRVRGEPGADVAITNFSYFCHFSAKKWRFSQ